MRGNPDGSLSSAGRWAPGLLSFRYKVWFFLSCHSMQRMADPQNEVAAGVNPAANAMSVEKRERP